MTLAGLFDRVQKIDHRVIRRAVGVAAFVFAAPFLMVSAAGIRINCSPSLPLGLYKRTTDNRAPLIEFCPQEPYGTFAAGRGYRSIGNCPDGAGPLMKPVVATAGDVVEVSDRGIAVNGQMLPNTAPKTKDSQGRAMTPWPYGHYRVIPGLVWVASSYNPWSFDSRYFGPIPIGIIRDRLRPFLTL
jgi:conjugative transfer signal peptidase TraF